MASNRYVLVALICFVSYFSSVNADAPSSQYTGPPFLNSTSSDPTDPNNCSTKHSGDYYGIGVRLGIYMIWLQSYLANTFLPGEISGALDANTIFLLALLAAIFRGTLIRGIAGEHLVKVDGLVLMQLSAGYMFGCLSIWGYRTIHYQKEGPAGVRHFGRIGTHGRLALECAISAYGVWFWTMGVLPGRGLSTLSDIYGKTREECYPLNTFFFAKLDVLGPIRYFYIVVSSSCTLYFGIMLFVASVERLRHLFRRVRARETKTVNYETGLKRQELDFIYAFLRVGNLVWIIFSVIMVELTLRWNRLKDVIGPGGQIAYPSQLLPLLIGSLTLIRMLWLIFKDKSENWNSRGETFSSQSSELQKEGLGITTKDEETVARRPFYVRCLVAWLPWLSQFGIWTRQPHGAHIESTLHQERTSQPKNRDSTMRILEKTPDTSNFPSTPFRDSYGASTGASPLQSPLIAFSPTK